jgi:hypothetical protein
MAWATATDSPLRAPKCCAYSVVVLLGAFSAFAANEDSENKITHTTATEHFMEASLEAAFSVTGAGRLDEGIPLW